MLTHQEVCANPNTTCSPPRGMCPLGIDTIWDNRWHFTLFIPFNVGFYFHALLQPLASRPFLLLVHSNCICPRLQLICIIYTSICIYSTLIACLHPFYLYHVFVIVKLLCCNGKKKIDTKCHTKNLGIYDWIYVNLKHIK